MILAGFSTFSQAQMIFFAGIIFATLYGAVRIMSLLALVMWSLMLISIVGVMNYNLDMLYFWFALMLEAISLALGIAVKSLY